MEMKVVPPSDEVRQGLPWWTPLGPGLVLATLGVAQIYAVVSGQSASLLHPGFRPLALGSGVLMVALAVMRVRWPHPEPVSWIRLGQGLVIIAGVLCALKFAPQTYSEKVMRNRGFASTGGLVERFGQRGSLTMQNRAPDEPLAVDVMDLLLAAANADSVQSLEGTPVRLIGQIMPLDEGMFKVTRMVVFCCAADAQPLGIKVKGQGSSLEAMSWVELEGVVHFQPQAERWEVQIQLQEMRSILAPQEVFLY